MQELQDTVRVDAPPDRVWTWLEGLAEHYLEWHPDHDSADWERGDPNEVGSVLRVVERIGGHREELRFEMIAIDPPRRMEYAILGPHALVVPGGAFTIVADDGGSAFTASIHVRLGVLTERILRRRVEALRTHMREEGENLKRLVEAGSFELERGGSKPRSSEGVPRRRSRPPRALRRAVRRELSTRFGRDHARTIIAEANRGYPTIAARIPAAGPGARHLMRLGAHAIALDRALVEHEIDSEIAVGLISDAVFESIRRSRDALDLLGRLRHRDRLRAVVWASDVARRFYYAEPDWVMEDVPVAGGFGMNVTRCVVAEFFDSLGMGEFCQRVICEQDVRSAEHHGITLERSGTLAGGADRCDFRYHLAPLGSR